MMSNSLGCYIGAPADPVLLPFAIGFRGEGGVVSLAAPQTSSLLPPPTGLNLWIRHCIGSILVTHTCMHIRYKNTSMLGKHSIKIISLFALICIHIYVYLLTIQYTSTQIQGVHTAVYQKSQTVSNFSQFAEKSTCGSINLPLLKVIRLLSECRQIAVYIQIFCSKF